MVKKFWKRSLDEHREQFGQDLTDDEVREAMKNHLKKIREITMKANVLVLPAMLESGDVSIKPERLEEYEKEQEYFKKIWTPEAIDEKVERIYGDKK